MIPNGTHLVYIFPVWTLATWALILVLSWCLLGMKRKIDKLTDKICEMSGRQDAYFGSTGSYADDPESNRIRDAEVKRIREGGHINCDEDDICEESSNG